jgi:hypothetical protein
VVRRHEILRAVFVAVEGVPHLQIRDFGRVELPVVDLAAIAASERAPRCDALAAELHEQPFDLSSGR